MSASLLEAALAYAEEGIAVFPCLKDKSPAISGGFHSASTDPVEIKQWWTDNPEHLIGGAVPEGHLIVDVDPRNGGRDTLMAFLGKGQRLATTRKARTGGRGTHWWYTTTLPADRTRSTFGDGIDIKRHDKGYVILPPSISDSGEYVWLVDDEPVPCPQWVLDVVTKPEKTERENNATLTQRPPWLTITAYGDVALKQEEQRILDAQPGERNDTLNRAAFSVFQLVGGGEIDYDCARERLTAAAYEIGLEEREIELTLDSAYDAAQDDVRAAPETVTEKIASEPAVGASYWNDWLSDQPPPPFYLDPVLPKNAYVIVYGATEASKSMVWNLLLADASHFGIRSTVYSLENPRHVDSNRLSRMKPNPAAFRLTNEPTDLAHWEQVEALIEREKKNNTDVLMFDTYSHIFASRNDDGNAKAIEFARIVRHIMHEVQCSVVCIDHTGYVQRDEPRDASAKRQQVDVAIMMEKNGRWEKGRNAHFQMTNNKASRFANPFESVRGAICDTKDGGLKLEWADQSVFGEWTR